MWSFLLYTMFVQWCPFASLNLFLVIPYATLQTFFLAESLSSLTSHIIAFIHYCNDARKMKFDFLFNFLSSILFLYFSGGSLYWMYKSITSRFVILNFDDVTSMTVAFACILGLQQVTRLKSNMYLFLKLKLHFQTIFEFISLLRDAYIISKLIFCIYITCCKWGCQIDSVNMSSTGHLIFILKKDELFCWCLLALLLQWFFSSLNLILSALILHSPACHFCPNESLSVEQMVYLKKCSSLVDFVNTFFEANKDTWGDRWWLLCL